ncbi:WD repeat-containing protein, partial [Candidatus Magnetomorum sp. HK-1]
CNLSQLYLTLGYIDKSVEYAKESTELSKANNDPYLIKSSLLYLADALHQQNKLTEAKKNFHTWENIVIEKKPSYPFLYSFGVGGFRFCDFLIAQGLYEKVIERASVTLDWAEKYQTPFDIGLDSLTLDRAYFFKSIKDKSYYFSNASSYLNKSVEKLREAGMIDHLPRALLARAKLYRFSKCYQSALDALNESLEISERSQMERYIADYHIESCYLCFITQEYDKMIFHFKLAQDMIQRMKYFRRVKEINELHEMIIQGDLELC